MSVLAQGSGGEALALAVVLAIIYMVIVRFMDLNEKEPLWAMALVFGIGFIAAVLLYFIVGSTILETRLVLGPVVREIGKFVAVGLAIGALQAIGRNRGWSEVDGALDGVVYGTAVGLGFATGAVLATQLLSSPDPVLEVLPAVGAFDRIWPVALIGLSEGLFGGVIGAGFGLAAMPKNRSRAAGFIAGGAVAAIVLHVAYTLLRRGAAATGAGRILSLLGLFLPVVVIAALIVWSLRQEKRTISEQLPSERDSGTVTEDDMRLLNSFGARRGAYLKKLTSGDFDGWADLKTLHNRQVQLAFAKERALHDPDAQVEVERLRASIHALHAERPQSTTPASTVEGTGA